MATNVDFEKQSLIRNFINFVNPLSDFDLAKLQQYMLEQFNDIPPNELQKDFIDKFVGFDGWGQYIQYYRREILLENSGQPRSLFRPMAVIEDITNLRNMLAVECSSRFFKSLKGNKLDKKPKDWNKKLKSDLNNAVRNSYYEGIFDKIEGWCNIYDVLSYHKLLEPTEED